MKRYTQEEIRQAVQTIADAYLSMYETMRDQKTVTIADDTVIQKLRKMGFPRQGRPLDNVVGEMLEDVCTNQALLQHPRFFAFVPSPASPLSWVGDVLTDAYNPHGGTWMESSAASCLEQETIQWLCRQAGYPPNSGRTVCLRWFHRQPDSAGGCPPCHAGGNRIQQRCGLPFGTGAFFYPESTADHGADQGADPHDPL